MLGFDSRHQESFNGPLTEPVRADYAQVRERGVTHQEFGQRCGLSDAHVANIMKPKTPANVSSKRVPAIIRALMEFKSPPGQPAASPSLQEAVRSLINAAERLGLDAEVRIGPKK